MLQERVTEVGVLYGFCITPPRTALWIEEMSSLVPPLPRGVKFKPAPLDPFGRPGVEERNDAEIHPWGDCRAGRRQEFIHAVESAWRFAQLVARGFESMLSVAGRRSASAALADVSEPCAQTRSTRTRARSRTPRTEIPSQPTRQAGARRPDERLGASR